MFIVLLGYDIYFVIHAMPFDDLTDLSFESLMSEYFGEVFFERKARGAQLHDGVFELIFCGDHRGLVFEQVKSDMVNFFRGDTIKEMAYNLLDDRIDDRLTGSRPFQRMFEFLRRKGHALSRGFGNDDRWFHVCPVD
jgi:hypothetical protein